MAEFKTYVLLDHMNPSNTSIYRRINKNQRQLMNKLPKYRPYMQVTFTDKDGNNKTIRYKSTTNEIYQDAQIKAGILANEKFRSQEYRDLEFTNSVITTNKPTVQKYLETYPGFAGFEGSCADVKRQEYTLYDKANEIKTSNATTKKRLEAGNKIFSLDLDGTKELLYRIYGSSYVPSEIVDDNHAALIEYLDGSDDAIEDILKETVNSDDEATILIGKLLTADLISFDALKGQVAKKKGKDWIPVKAISNEYSFDERKRHLGEFLTSDAGKTLWDDLEKDLKRNSNKV